MVLREHERLYHEACGIPKSQLIDQAYYAGICRNATIARWSAARNEFFYEREKFGVNFIESLPCPEDAIDGYDYFEPELLIDNPAKEIPIE